MNMRGSWGSWKRNWVTACLSITNPSKMAETIKNQRIFLHAEIFSESRSGDCNKCDALCSGTYVRKPAVSVISIAFTLQCACSSLHGVTFHSRTIFKTLLVFKKKRHSLILLAMNFYFISRLFIPLRFTSPQTALLKFLEFTLHEGNKSSPGWPFSQTTSHK